MNNPLDSIAELKHLGILAGLEDVLAGRTTPHAQVKEWAANLLPSAPNVMNQVNRDK